MTSKARALLSFALESPLPDAVARAAEALERPELREAARLLSLFSAHVLAQDPERRP